MDINPYVWSLQQQLAVAAAAGGEDARALAERLIAPLESATRLVLLEALAAAANEITCDLAPGSVDLRLRGRDPEFVVTPPPAPAAFEEALDSQPTRPQKASVSSESDDDGGTTRITLRVPEALKLQMEEAASREGLSVNAWQVRVLTAALKGNRGTSPDVSPSGGERFTGWVR